MKKVFVKLFFILVAVAFLIYLYNQARQPGDFKVYLEAAQLVWQGKSPYNVWIFVSEGNYCEYFYSPLWATILIPLTYLPSIVANFIWLLVNVFFLLRIGIILKKYLVSFNLSRNQMILIFLFTVMCSVRFILYNFDMIQMTLFLLWGSLEAIEFMKKEKHWQGGLILALVINIKLLPLVIIPYLIYRKFWKGFTSSIIWSVLLLFLPGVIVGFEFNNILISDWLGTINPSNSEFSLETGLGANGLASLVPSLLTNLDTIEGVPRNIANLSAEKVSFVLNLTRGFFILTVLLVLKMPLFSKSNSEIQSLREISYLLLLVPLIFPHQQKYAFAMCIPAWFYLSFYLVYLHQYRIEFRGRYISVLIFFALSFILMTLTTDGVVGRKMSDYFQYFHTITNGAILLAVAIIIAQHQTILSKKEALQIALSRDDIQE